MTARPEPTPEQLAAALHQLHANRLLLDLPHVAAATPAQARLVRMHAALQARGIATVPAVVQRPAVQAPQPPHPATPTPSTAARRRPPAALDNKRAAAGERPED